MEKSTYLRNGFNIFPISEGKKRMTVAKVTFQKLITNSQEYGSNDEHMVSRAFFNVEIDGHVAEEVYVDIKQTIGTDFEAEPLEIGPPVGYNGPFNHEKFRGEVEEYYRGLVGSQGSALHITVRGKKILMQNGEYFQQKQVEIELSQEGPAW